MGKLLCPTCSNLGGKSQGQEKQKTREIWAFFSQVSKKVPNSSGKNKKKSFLTPIDGRYEN